MKVIIVPDAPMVKMARQACEIQDACNGTAVSGFLNRTMCSLMKYGEGGDCRGHTGENDGAGRAHHDPAVVEGECIPETGCKKH